MEWKRQPLKMVEIPIINEPERRSPVGMPLVALCRSANSGRFTIYMMVDGVETENSDATFRAHTAHTWLFDLVSSYFILFHVISCYLVLSKCRNFKK